MALQKTTTTLQGFTATEAYHRVEGIVLTQKNKITFQVRSYKEVDLPFFSDVSHTTTFDLEGPNPIKQAYLYLKTIPEFADATDC
jgi:hypothetical protein